MKIDIDRSVLIEIEGRLKSALALIRESLKASEDQQELFEAGAPVTRAEKGQRLSRHPKQAQEFVSTIIKILPGEFTTRDVLNKARSFRPELRRGALLGALNRLTKNGILAVDKPGGGRRPTTYINRSK